MSYITGTMMNIVALHYIAQPDFIHTGFFK